MKGKANLSVIAVLAAASAAVFYLGNRAACTFTAGRLQIGGLIGRLISLLPDLWKDIKNNPAYIGTGKNELTAGAAAACALWLKLHYDIYMKPMMQEAEHGSARWGSAADIKPLCNPEFRENLIFTRTEGISIGAAMPAGSGGIYRNANALCIGGSGSGKKRSFIVPNILQMSSSYVITDPNGELYRQCAPALEQAGYRVRRLNLIDMQDSDFYNPFAYIQSEADIIKLATNLIANTTDEGNGGDEFFVKAETALLTAIFAYVHYEHVEEERTLATVMDYIECARTESGEGGSPQLSPLDILFEGLKKEYEEAKKEEPFAVRQYAVYRQAAGETLERINIAVGVRLQAFNINAVRSLASKDTIGLGSLGNEPSALFVLMPDTDTSFNFIAAMCLQQMFDMLVRQADKSEGGRLKMRVQCMLNEFANIGQIPMFDILISTIRSKGISVAIAVQNLAQLKNAYKDTWATIAENCDSLLFLGSNDLETLKYISEVCGKTTIVSQSMAEQKGPQGSYSVQSEPLSRDLITAEEAGRLGGNECILKVRGLPAFRSHKFDVSEHPSFGQLNG
ncbi:MAG: type IV secretory system conjugative DNA transfer family protein [Eubacteriaceae bacterium]|nr:type IV secretory system conjugative DNA transfer family protein [Eubacteriaceae bacterium]